MDAPGKRGELHDMARRLGSVGYCVLLPNLYYRRDQDFRVGASERRAADRCGTHDSLNRKTVLTDTAAMLEFADGDRAARRGKVGVVGYCMSGPFVFWAAAEHADRVAAAASFHGVGCAPTIRNRRTVTRIRSRPSCTSAARRPTPMLRRK